jgi:hypothetical protein
MVVFVCDENLGDACRIINRKLIAAVVYGIGF